MHVFICCLFTYCITINSPYNDPSIPEACSTTEYGGSEKNLFTRSKTKEVLDCKHTCMDSSSLILMALVSSFSSWADLQWVAAFFLWMVTPIHQPLILEDAGSPLPPTPPPAVCPVLPSSVLLHSYRFVLVKVGPHKGKIAGQTNIGKGGRQAAISVNCWTMSINGKCCGEDTGQLLVLDSACHLHNYWDRQALALTWHIVSSHLHDCSTK